MSSAEVFCWGSLGPICGEALPAPIGAGRRGLGRQVYAGAGHALLARAEDAVWLPDQRGLDVNGKDSNGTWSLQGIECAAFGQNHTLLLRKIPARAEDDSPDNAGGDAKTEVLSWGIGNQGQLGLGAGTLESKLPRPIPAFGAYRVVQVACGAQHSAAVTSSGDLFTWGRGIEGQLGHASPHLPPELNDAITGMQLRPKPVPAFVATKKRQRPVARVSCGVNFTLVVTRAGEVWAFGGGTAGQLGIGRLTRTGVPKVVMPSCSITGEPFLEVAAGWAHALARTSGGRVFSWGFNAFGSLGLGDHRTRFFPEAVSLGGGSEHLVASDSTIGGATTKTAFVSAVKIDASGNSSGALTADGELFTWGCSNGGLGHRAEGRNQQQSRSGAADHVLRPRRVQRLAGARIADFALSQRGGIAIVPLRVKSIEPASGPLETGCRVLIRGNGFWDSPDIVIKFTPVSKGHKPSASRSAMGTYLPREADQSGDDVGDGTERVTCEAPCFASQEAVYVEVSIDGTSFTTDSTLFHYYRTPELSKVTPEVCRPPFPKLRLDGELFTPNDTLLVRFEEEEDEVEGSHEGEISNGKTSAVLFGGEDSFCRGADDVKASLPSRSPPRVFIVPGRVESETIEIGTDPDTELPIHEERRFITCDSPALAPGSKLPFVSRLTIAPNGANFNGRPLRFVTHDPHADLCLPRAVPVPATNEVGGDGSGQSGGSEATGPRIRIAGRNLYRGAGLGVRLRFGLGDESVISLQAVSFDAASKSIVGHVPPAADALFGKAGSKASQEPPPSPAVSVAVEVSVDGQEYFAVPERLTVYRRPNLTLHGDGFFPVCGGGWAELKATESTFRGHETLNKVRLVSDVHGIDVTLPLLSTPPPVKVEERNGEAAGTPSVGVGEGAPPPKQAPSDDANKHKSPPPAQRSAEGNVHVEDQGDRAEGSASNPGNIAWEKREVPASKDSFFFAVPPLPKSRTNRIKEVRDDPGSCNDGNVLPNGQDQDTVASATQHSQSVSSRPLQGEDKPNSSMVGSEERRAEDTTGREAAKTAVALLVSLNGNDWQPVSGLPLTYFRPPPEPEPEPDEEPKKGKSRKK